ncbi:MAG TPA: glycosyltransferase [Terriglobales bacterium]|nr:glycosyltransferase [Terriglobales bacterium]
MSTELSVIITAYNEAQRITPTLQRINNYLESCSLSSQMLVVLDGPTDNTLGVVREIADEVPNLKIVERTDHRGKGYTVKQGMLRAVGQVRLFCGRQFYGHRPFR